MIAIDSAGSGEPLVLLHGVGTSRVVWRRAIPELADGRLMVAADMPGFGDSPAAGAGFELDEVAEALAEGLVDRGAADRRPSRARRAPRLQCRGAAPVALGDGQRSELSGPR